MQGSQIELNSATYDELLGTLEVAEMWDKKGNGTEAAQPRPSGKGLTTSYKKRDSPFDGMRMLYMEDQASRGLSATKLAL